MLGMRYAFIRFKTLIKAKKIIKLLWTDFRGRFAKKTPVVIKCEKSKNECVARVDNAYKYTKKKKM